MPDYFPSFLVSSHYSDRRIFVLMFVLIVSLIVDTLLSRISNLGINELSFAGTKLSIFAAIAAVYIVGQYVILGWLSRQNTEFRTMLRHYFNLIKITVTMIQYVLTAIFVLIILQIFLWSYYSTLLLMLGATISIRLQLP